MKNKRMYERIDVSKDFIPVEITNNGKTFMVGMAKDISKIGLSFYSFEQAVLPVMGKHISISFRYQGIPCEFELELLRETKRSIGYLCAGKFIGVSCSTQANILHLFTMAQAKELVLV